MCMEKDEAMYRCGILCVCVCVAVRKSNAEVEAMRRQAKGLAQEYDRLLSEHHQLQVTQKHKCTHTCSMFKHSHKYLLFTDSTNTAVIIFLILYLLHRIFRVLKTKRISNQQEYHFNRIVCYMQ